MSIQRERRHLARVFQAALLAAGAPSIVIACSSSGPPVGTTPEAGAPASRDATLDSFVGPDGEAGSLPDVAAPPPPSDAAKPPPPVEAGPDTGGCYAGAYELDAGPDADRTPDTCAYVYACGLGGTGLGASGCQVLQIVANGELAPIPQTTCWLPQDAGCNDDAYAPDDEAGGVIIYCTPCPTGGGRRPAGLRTPVPSCGETALGAYLASMAFEEDASIVAFERMRGELGSLGAPATLATAAGRAARDEARHARTMAALAIARRGVVTKARVRRLSGRCAADVAAENAAEGCVRETYGALLARWQSLHAGDLELRRAFERIAADEARHAALSWAVARWVEPRLDAVGRRRVTRSRARALRALRASVSIEPSPELVRAAGLPTATEARALLDAMIRELSPLSEPRVDDLRGS